LEVQLKSFHPLFLVLALFANAQLGLESHAGARKSKTNSEVLELVQTVPSETDLAVPGVRHAKEEWIRLIDESQKTIDIEQMYLDGEPGHAMDDVVAALVRAGKRGVKVRLLVAKAMMRVSGPTVERLKQTVPGIETQILDLGTLTGGIQHAKFFIFDGKTGFVGSQNADWKALSEILETGVTFSDSTVVAQLQSIFDLDWKMAETGKIPDDLGTATTSPASADVVLVAAPPSLNPKNVPSMYDALVGLLQNAKKRVRITLLDYSTFKRGETQEWLELDQVLRETAKRGVKIELLLSHWNTEKPEIESIKNLGQVKNIDVRIATVPEKSTGPIPFARVNHSKMMVVDDEVLWVGTSNWDHGYFFKTRGIEIIMKRPKLAEQGNQIFDRLWNAIYAEPVDPARDYPKPRK
jgi:phosphatidylserine/phosphatidylglycerophosphate/cardiolipin synthase-like enzyme